MKVSIAKKCIGTVQIFFLLATVMHADTRLVLNVTHLPQSEISAIKAELNKDASLGSIIEQNGTPGSMANHQVEQMMKLYLTPKLSGFPVIYAGYITVTGNDGLAMFPLRHAQQKLYIAITPDIRMIKVKGESFSHTEYAPNATTPLALYKCEKIEEKLKDGKMQAFWKATKIENPDSMRINPITIVVLTHPDNIFIEQKDFIISEPSEQIVMPPLRVIGNQDKELVSLRLIDIAQYFEKVRIEQKRATDTTVQKITTTF